MAADEQAAMDEALKHKHKGFQLDITAMHEQLAILVSTVKAKEAVSVMLTQHQVRCLEEKDGTTKGTRLSRRQDH